MKRHALLRFESFRQGKTGKKNKTVFFFYMENMPATTIDPNTSDLQLRSCVLVLLTVTLASTRADCWVSFEFCISCVCVCVCVCERERERERERDLLNVGAQFKG
jgi:hypothetical protein